MENNIKIPSTLALEKAAQCWCDDRTKHIVMIPELAVVFAELLDSIWSNPWLGNATTSELLDELRCRCEVNGTINYKTVDE
jgi:hypothetical protein